MILTTTEKPIDPRINLLAERHAKAQVDLLKAYAAVNDKAVIGRRVTAADFNIPEERYNTQVKEIYGQAEKLFHSDEARRDIVKLSEKMVDQWKLYNYPILNKLIDPEPLEAVFRRDYLAKAPIKNLSIPDGTDTEEKLIAALLAKNPGIAVGGFHGKSADMPFVYKNIKTFNKSRGDTIYMELDTANFEYFNKQSVRSLKQRLKQRTPQKISEDNKERASRYELAESDDLGADFYKLFIAAKENGIVIVNHDKQGEARKIEDVTHRLASTNYTWTEKILADRKNKPKNGKYIVLGGGKHFSDDDKSKGYVDEALGIPYVNFDNRDIGADNPIAKGSSKHGADFYLPGGSCYPEAKKLIEATDVSDAADKIRATDPKKADSLANLARKYIEEYGASLQLKCNSESEASSKQAVYVPTKPVDNSPPQQRK